MVDPPNELELNRALTQKINHLMCVMKAISRFRGLLKKRRAAVRAESEDSQRQPSLEFAQEKANAEDIEAFLLQRKKFLNRGDKEDNEGGQTQEAEESEPKFLGIGTGERDAFATNEATPDIVSDSPTAVDFNVYDRAYENAIEKITAAQKPSKIPTVYLTKFVKERDHFRELGNMVEGGDESGTLTPVPTKEQQPSSPSTGILAQLASKIGISSSEGDEKPKAST